MVNKKNLFVVLISLIFGIVCLYIPFTNNLQNRVFDSFFQEKQPSNKVIILSIDNSSIQKLGGWPLKRVYFSKVLDNLKSADVVGFDIAFVDPSIYGQDDDMLFKQKLYDFSQYSKVIIPFQFDSRFIKTIDPIFKTENTGFANILVDNDGIVRNFFQDLGDNKSFSLSVLGKSRLETDSKIKIDYVGSDKTFPNIPFIDVYNGKIPEDFFKNKIVLIGATSPDLHDFFHTPFGIISGVEIQANIISTIDNANIFRNLNFYLTIFLLFIFSILPIYLFKLKNIIYSVLASSLLLFSINLASFILFQKYILVSNIVLSISFITSSVLFIIMRYSQESKEKKFIRNMFQYYLTPDVVSELVSNPEKLSLGGEKKNLAIFFSDIRGFTTISESLSPEQLTSLLNQYLGSMTDILMDNRGVLDKYIGDAVMAFWGAPVENINKVFDACNSAILMSESLRRLNIFWLEKGFPKISIGMGINLGDVVVGNMGSSRRFNYTIMGDEVNFASRLEGLTKNYFVECLVSQSVYENLKNDQRFKFRFIDNVIVKGKTEPKKIYELITFPNENTSIIINDFNLAMDFYIKGDFKKSKFLFKEIFEKYNDFTSDVFYKRSLELDNNKPLSWNGVYEFKTK